MNKSASQHLNKFVVATIIVGVSLLAGAWPAVAEIVYTHANATIFNGSRYFALNNGAVFQITSAIYYSEDHLCVIGGDVSETAASGNGALVGPLKKGAEIGPDQVFSGGTADLESFYLVKGEPPCGDRPFHYSGPWKLFGYLGLSFLVSGETYYGWAQLNILEGGQGGVHLSGYAYEDIPGMPINAGQTKDTEDDSALSAAR